MINMFLDRIEEARSEESAFTTAELLGNAALGIVAVVAIWGLLKVLGVSIIDWITSALQTGGATGVSDK